MISTFAPVDIPEADPFKNDALNRKETAENLTRLIATMEDSVVLSVAAPWGAGKTTFIRMLQKHLRNEGFDSLYFNAWKNDFVSDPLIAFIDEISTLIQRRGLEDESAAGVAFNKMKSIGGSIAKHSLPTAVKILTHGALDLNELAESDLSEFAQKSTSALFERYQTEKGDITAFRETLREFAESLREEDNGGPLVFFVDELDRCRPDYAVELLERIKHLFDVPGIVFVLALAPSQLKHSVKSLYGADMDAMGYLRRFIDLEYRLPDPEPGQYLQYLYSRTKLDAILKNRHNPASILNFLKVAKGAASIYQMSLRDQEQYVTRLELAFRVMNQRRSLAGFLIGYVAFLVALRMERSDLYDDMLTTQKREEEVIQEARKFTTAATGLIQSIKNKSCNSQYVMEAAVQRTYSELLDEQTDRIKQLTDLLNEYHSEEGNEITTVEAKRYDNVRGALRAIHDYHQPDQLGRELLNIIEMAVRFE